MRRGYTLWPLRTGSAASGDNAFAFGRNSSAAGDNAFAFGKDSNAGHLNSMAIGFGAMTAFANQIVFGSATNTYTLAGITSAASTAAQGAIHGLITTDSGGNLASDGGALDGRVDVLEAASAEEFTDKAAAMQAQADALKWRINKRRSRRAAACWRRRMKPVKVVVAAVLCSVVTVPMHQVHAPRLWVIFPMLTM